MVAARIGCVDALVQKVDTSMLEYYIVERDALIDGIPLNCPWSLLLEHSFLLNRHVDYSEYFPWYCTQALNRKEKQLLPGTAAGSGSHKFDLVPSWNENSYQTARSFQ